MGRRSRERRERGEADAREAAAPRVRSFRGDLRRGVGTGLALACGLSLVAGARLLLEAAGADGAPRIWMLATVYYLVAGVLGGTVWALLRPIQDRYWGRYLTASLIIFLVYGGVAFLLPLIDGEPVDVPQMLAVCAVVGLVMAPLYVRVARRW